MAKRTRGRDSGATNEKKRILLYTVKSRAKTSTAGDHALSAAAETENKAGATAGAIASAAAPALVCAHRKRAYGAKPGALHSPACEDVFSPSCS